MYYLLNKNNKPKFEVPSYTLKSEELFQIEGGNKET